VEATWKNISIGFSARYNSHMSNIDRTFEDGIYGTQILTGLKEYRVINNKGALVFDARIGYTIKEHYRIGFIVNNVLNTEYSTRPGDIQAPRTFLAQLQFNF
jgi:iron complex outermembrane receptor protein